MVLCMKRSARVRTGICLQRNRIGYFIPLLRKYLLRKCFLFDFNLQNPVASRLPCFALIDFVGIAQKEK